MANVANYEGPGALTKFGFGQSNPTFRLSTPSSEYVLRRKPFGHLLLGAHAIEREYRVLDALEQSDVRTPRVYGICGDASLLGAPFYVMEFVEGRIFYDQRLPELDLADRHAIFDSMNAAVASLHNIDPADVGLCGFGRGENFVERQVALWTRQYRASEGKPITEMEQLIAWLPKNLPPQQPVRIFHGDLRLDNIVFHSTRPEVVALLDWELSTLGDPLADFAYHAIVWRIPADLFRGFGGLDLPSLGIPIESDYVQQYCQRTGRECIPEFGFYQAFSFFRLAAILQGIWQRAQDGNASADDALEIGERAAPLARIGWEIARATAQ